MANERRDDEEQIEPSTEAEQVRDDADTSPAEREDLDKAKKTNGWTTGFRPPTIDFTFSRSGFGPRFEMKGTNPGARQSSEITFPNGGPARVTESRGSPSFLFR